MPTNVNTDLKAKLRPASRIGRNHWHARKRQQMMFVPKRHDWDTLRLQGAATREIQQRGIKSITKGKLFRKINGIREKKDYG
jgi:hypothetical protein